MATQHTCLTVIERLSILIHPSIPPPCFCSPVLSMCCVRCYYTDFRFLYPSSDVAIVIILMICMTGSSLFHFPSLHFTCPHLTCTSLPSRPSSISMHVLDLLPHAHSHPHSHSLVDTPIPIHPSLTYSFSCANPYHAHSHTQTHTHPPRTSFSSPHKYLHLHLHRY